ncbi:MAG: NAD(+) diphosphatase [Xanthomonadales bacterium]|nr:NAD(+) diphosphatase [Xanthomonadales bacterium]
MRAPGGGEPSTPAAAGRSYAFAAADLDRCAELRDDDVLVAGLALSADADWLFLREDGAAVLTPHHGLALVPGDALELLPPLWLFLGRRGGRALFTALHPQVAPAPAGEWTDLRTAAARLPGSESGLLAAARGLLAWRQRHRWCGACGGLLQVAAAGHRLQCPGCGSAQFPRTDPAIIVAVRHGEACLLGRQAAWAPGRWSTLAGFVEPGETLEAAVAREVREEAGVTVAEAHYLGSQPWPFPGSIMLGFEAHAVSRDIAVGDELEDARWFDPDQLAAGLADGTVVLSPPLSIARWLLEHWHREITGRPIPDGRAW